MSNNFLPTFGRGHSCWQVVEIRKTSAVEKRLVVRTSGMMQENKGKRNALSQLRFIHSTFHITNI